MRWYLLIFYLFTFVNSNGQAKFNEQFNSLRKQNIDNGITLTFDEGELINPSNPTKIIIYALPNGNTTAQTFGKITRPGDDWHYDIQHIAAQTTFIRKTDPHTNYFVIYLENDVKSWPAWRKKMGYHDELISEIVQSIFENYKKYHPKITLSGHSGGGSFIFGFINAQNQIPAYIERIGFLDATYGYETEMHKLKLEQWLKTKNKSLQVIAYNDSVVVYNGKLLVSPTGGTWYRSKLMVKDLQTEFRLKKYELTDRLNWYNKRHLIEFSLIKNPEAKIYHTVLVEKNGFIQLIFNGTKYGETNYKFWSERIYQSYIPE